MSTAYPERAPAVGEAASKRPAWMATVQREVAQGHPDYFRAFAPPPGPHRRSAVLMLFGPGAQGEEVVLTERSPYLRAHPGQVSFPGGTVDPQDASPTAAALREAHEEVGIEPDSVDVVLTLPELFLSPSGNVVTPVLAWWARPGTVRVVDPAEVVRAEAVPLSTLLDPQHRFTVTHPMGYRGPGFDANGMFVWGFTAMLLSTLLDLAGIAPPWDATRERPLPDRLASPGMRR